MRFTANVTAGRYRSEICFDFSLRRAKFQKGSVIKAAVFAYRIWRPSLADEAQK